MKFYFGSKRIGIIDRDSRPLTLATMQYLLLMLVAILLRTYVTQTVTIVWIVNLIGLIGCFIQYYRYINNRILLLSLLYILTNLISLFVNIDLMTLDLKAIGTNINIVVFPLYLFLFYIYSKEKPFDDGQIKISFSLISSIGLCAVLFAWITGYRDIIRVFQGNLSAYRTSSAGFFYGKNIYGAFVSLTIVPDLYLYRTEHDKKRIYSIIVKIIAVILSFSRAALLQMAIFLLLYFLLSKKHTKTELLLIIGVIIIIALIASRPNAVRTFFINSVFRMSVGDAGRARARMRALTQMGTGWKRIIFGVGYAGIDALNLDLDNTYLYILLSGGVFKFTFFSVLIIVFFVKSVKGLRTDNHYMSVLCLTVGMSYLVFAFFESISIFELGLINFLYTFYMFFIPVGYNSCEIIDEY